MNITPPSAVPWKREDALPPMSEGADEDEAHDDGRDHPPPADPRGGSAQGSAVAPRLVRHPDILRAAELAEPLRQV